MPPSVCGDAATIVFCDPTITVSVNGVDAIRVPETSTRPVGLD
jgi:hypothetical protein